MESDPWVPSEPATRTANEEEIVEHLAWPREWEADPDQNRARAAAGLERLLRLGLPFREERGARFFDPYEVFYFMRWAHRRHGDPLWSQAIRIARELTAEFLPPRREAWRFQLRFEREISLRGRAPGSLFRTQLLLPLEDASVTDVTVDTISSPGMDVVREGGRIDLRTPVPEGPDPSMRFSVQLVFSAGWRGESVDPGHVEAFRPPAAGQELFLATAEGPIRVTERIRALSTELGSGCRTPWDAVRAFWRFIGSRIVFGRIHPHVLSADDPLGSLLDRGRSDCYHGSALLAALCRARGIPARLVTGYTLLRHVQTNHWWVEIFIPPYGWLPCDLACFLLADGDPENEWSELFLGRIDPRLVLERFPRETMVLDPPLPRRTYTLQRPCDRGLSPGSETILRELDRNRVLLHDRVRALRD